MKTILGFVDSEELLKQTVGCLQDAGFANESVTIVNPNGNPIAAPTSGGASGLLSWHSRRGELVRDGHTFYVQGYADARSIQPGEHLVVVRTADEHAQRAMNVLSDTGAQDVTLCKPAEQGEIKTDVALQVQDRLSTTICWSARLFGLVLVAIVLSFFIGEGLCPRNRIDS